jgi:coenzyme F420-reducing hydrogenase delta subunit
MFNMSAAMAGQFAATAQEMAEQIGRLGPSPLRIPPTRHTQADMESET